MNLLTIRQAAAILGLSNGRVYDFCKTGRLPAQQVGENWIIRRNDLDAFAAQTRKPGRPRKDTAKGAPL